MFVMSRRLYVLFVRNTHVLVFFQVKGLFDVFCIFVLGLEETVVLAGCAGLLSYCLLLWD